MKSKQNWFCTNLHKDLGRYLNFTHTKRNNFTNTEQFISLLLFLISESRMKARPSLHTSEVMSLSEQSVLFCFQSQSLGRWFLTCVPASLTTNTIVFRKRRHWAYLSIFSTTTRFASLFIASEIIIPVSPLIHWRMFCETRLKNVAVNSAEILELTLNLLFGALKAVWVLQNLAVCRFLSKSSTLQGVLTLCCFSQHSNSVWPGWISVPLFLHSSSWWEEFTHPYERALLWQHFWNRRGILNGSWFPLQKQQLVCMRSGIYAG